MINLIKTIVKSNSILIIIAEKISTKLKINFEDEYKIASFIKNPRIIDIGAHLGESIYNFKKYSSNSKIYSFEPNKQLFNKLKLIEKKLKGVKIYNYAISVKKIKYLFVPKIYGFKLTLWSTFSKNYLKNRWLGFTGINFKKLSLSKIKIKSEKLDKFKLIADIIKIDAEGSEYEVIKSASNTIKRNFPLLIIEFHKSNFVKIKKELRKYNYIDYLYLPKKNKLNRIDKNQYNKILNKKTSTNVVFYSNKSNLINKKYFQN